MFPSVAQGFTPAFEVERVFAPLKPCATDEILR